MENMSIGISLSTAYRWIKSGKITEDFRTFGNHRRFNFNTIKEQFIDAPNEKNIVAVYARVSSHDQKNDLIRQQDKLLNYCKQHSFNNIQLISDLGSGLNYKK